MKVVRIRCAVCHNTYLIIKKETKLTYICYCTGCHKRYVFKKDEVDINDISGDTDEISVMW